MAESSFGFEYFTGTTQERLDSCIYAQERIKAHGKYRSVNNRILQESDLRELMEMEKYLRSLLASEAAPSRKVNYATRGRAV